MQRVKLTLKRPSESYSDKTSEESESEILPVKKLKITLPGSLISHATKKVEVSDWPELDNLGNLVNDAEDFYLVQIESYFAQDSLIGEVEDFVSKEA